MRFECQKCGECCKNSAIYVTHTDIRRWQSEQRWDIIGKVMYVITEKTMGFVIPETLVDGGVCPFLTKDNKCSIHDTKPRLCKDFPFNAPADKLEACKGIGIGKPISRRKIEKILLEQFDDLKHTLTDKFTETYLTLLFSEFVKNGMAVYDEASGRYKVTEKGLDELGKKYPYVV